MRKTTLICLLMALPALPALAAPPPAQSWQLIDKRGSERISLDKTRISRLANGQTAAWSRLALGFDIPDSHSGVRYTTIEALNSYNCSKREYMTLKRVYVDGKGRAVREEKVEAPRNVSIVSGSFEEKLLPHVCKPRAVGEMREVAEKVVAAMYPPATGSAKAGGQRKPQAITVADNGQGPRLIELPKIDPDKADRPPPPLPSKPEIKKPVNDKADEPSDKAETSAKAKEKVLAEKPAQEKTAKPAGKNGKVTVPDSDIAPNYHTGAVSRAEIERQLATFGPRKARAANGKSAAGTSAKAKPAAPPPHWAYDGKGGPEFWAHLSPDNHACASGKRQSPIDIDDGIRVDLEPIKFAYGPSAWSVLDNGHTIQVNIPDGHSITIMGRSYQLLQFHFHKPAEEKVNGRSYDMVAHFVHKDADGRLAVVAVLMEKSLSEHPQVQAIWNNLPLEQGMLVAPSTSLDLDRLLPETRDYWTYMGSLTTPPCTEGVLWMVMKQPLQISAEQIAIFGRLYPHNARPIQPSHKRLIKESR